jgi:site-specific DNA-methyltransferase (adenine-specific)
MTTGGARERRGTGTSNFGVSRRESHDASGFYSRFVAPELSEDKRVAGPLQPEDPFICGDSRDMADLRDNSVALVVTSPPYFAGKQYEEELGRDGVPASYMEYLGLLRDVFAECKRVLEPGGRIAVNVANLGRKPYRSLSSDVIRILQDDLGLLLRGEIIWKKAEGATGNCAWGSYRSATNPVLRDVTERIVVASKGRFDRAVAVRQREADGLPATSTLLADDFMALTLDVWDIPPESATRVGHPAPFPVELPEQLIRLYTFEGDLVLDPFMGSGSSLVAAARTQRAYVGYDLDPAYVEIARGRVADEEARRADREAVQAVAEPAPAGTTAEPEVDPEGDTFQRRATREGKAAQKLAEQVLSDCGFRVEERNRTVRGTGVRMNFTARDADGMIWYFDVSGAFTSHRGGLLRTDTVWKSLGRAHALREHLQLDGGQDRIPLVFLTTHLPRPRSEGDVAMRSAGPDAFFDAICLLDADDHDRLARYASGGHRAVPLPGFWSQHDLDRLGG